NRSHQMICYVRRRKIFVTVASLILRITQFTQMLMTESGLVSSVATTHSR
ncbi:hypothetical protein D043_0485B, partial [Vibrio parahaemolyticus EKP-021]